MMSIIISLGEPGEHGEINVSCLECSSKGNCTGRIPLVIAQAVNVCDAGELAGRA